MKHTYQVIEDNGGGLHLFIFDQNDKVIRGISNLEYLSHEDFMACINDLDNGSDGSDWEGQYGDPQAIYDEFNSSDFGSEVVGNESRTWPERMGRAAQIAYGVDGD